MRMKPCFFSCSCVLVKTASGPAYANSNAPCVASPAPGSRVWYSWSSSLTVRFLIVPAKASDAVRLADQRQVEAERGCSRGIPPRPGCSPAAGPCCGAGNRPKRMITATCRWKISWKAFSGSSGASSSIARPHSSMHRCWSSSASEWVSARQRKTRSIGRSRPPDADAQPALHQRQAARVAGVHLGRVAVHVAAELVEHDHQRHQQARVLDVERPVVVVPPRRQRHVGAEPVPDLLVGLLELAEPEVQALLDARAQHVARGPARPCRSPRSRSGSARSAAACAARAAGSPSPPPTARPARPDRRGSRAATAGCGGPSPGSILAMRSFICRSRRTSVFISWTALLRIGLGGGDERVVGGHEAFGVGHRPDRGGSRPRLDQAHLAEDVAGRQGPDGSWPWPPGRCSPRPTLRR